MESGGSRRRLLLSVEKTDSANLRDLLRVKEDDNGPNTATGLTLSTILSNEKRLEPVQSNRTLLDIIRDDPTGNGKDGKHGWKSFKDKLRLRRAGAAWTSSFLIPASDVPIQNSNRMMTRRQSTRFPTANAPNSDDPTQQELSYSVSSAAAAAANGGESRATLSSIPSNRAMMLRHNSSRIPDTRVGHFDDSAPLNISENDASEPAEAAVGEAEEGVGETVESMESALEAAEQAEAGGEQPARMSLMALLAQTDREMGLDGSTYTMGDEEEEEEEEVEEESGGRGGGVEYNNCCVCMVRHKGAAFIPCGHTFCRLCSRELWVQRGNCPLCNGFILEILDIF